ncbi:hypothetical protein FACS1894133_3410 [Clostridia bacterium]|nr:hypothetical protein FACS1894133_3410 [Clostridia bacterium]
MALKPYNQIQAEMKNLGFLHLQKSVYKSKDVMSDTDLTAIIKDLDQKLPWLCDCVSKIHTADIINEQSFDLNEILQATNITRKQYERTRFTVEADKR